MHVFERSALTFPFEENTMSTIVIKDLSESVELDREAMVAITGGSRIGGRQPFVGRQLRSKGLVTFPKGFVSHSISNKQTKESKTRK
jgi:hypothetical protein